MERVARTQAEAQGPAGQGWIREIVDSFVVEEVSIAAARDDVMR
jgi:hypothetical protein